MNVWLQPELALVGVDTDARSLDGTVEPFSKMIPLIHMNAILAATGTTLFAGFLFQGCQSVGLDVDKLSAQMPKILPLVYDRMVEAIKMAGMRFAADPAQSSAVLVGWSAQENRMIGNLYERRDSRGSFVCTSLPYGAYVQPGPTDLRWADRLLNLPEPKTPEAMSRLAQEQTKIIKEFISEIAAGGQFIVAQLTRRNMNIRAVCEL